MWNYLYGYHYIIIFFMILLYCIRILFIRCLQFKDGKNKTVQQWLDVRGTMGVYSKRFTIPRHSNKGLWRVVVESMVNVIRLWFIYKKGKRNPNLQNLFLNDINRSINNLFSETKN